MKASQMYLYTLREVPAEAEIASHVLLLRAGYIRKLVSGVYGFMTLGTRTLRKIEQIVREEMDATGAQEIYMSALQPAELWQESGRWAAYGPEMWRLKDRSGRDFCLGPTHEEVFTDIVRRDVSSYRQLPFNLYQIQTKYRDEARPRFGLIRSREFIMKDDYSFDKDEEGLDISYKAMHDAYIRIFDRCGLNYKIVDADSGAIGGSGSQEFTALCEVGEGEILYCENCGMAATAEKAEFKDAVALAEEELPLEKKFTPGTKSIEDVCNFLGIDQSKSIKALLFTVQPDAKEPATYVAAFIRGDRQLNMIKLVNALDVPEYAIDFANEDAMHESCGSVGGFTGPMGLKNCKIVVDSELVGAKNMCSGACELDHHFINVNYGRDYKADIICDLKLLEEGMPCPVCGSPVESARGIEVGQIFKLYTKYSEAMGLYFTDEEGQEKPVVMGCYGIGVSRTMAAIVEQNHDEHGIVWPMSVAPYHAIISLLGPEDEVQKALAEDIYGRLTRAGVETILDDRNERPGVKFKDADLIGIPIRIVVGRKAAEGLVEYKLRRGGEVAELGADEAIARAMALVEKERKGI